MSLRLHPTATTATAFGPRAEIELGLRFRPSIAPAFIAPAFIGMRARLEQEVTR